MRLLRIAFRASSAPRARTLIARCISSPGFGLEPSIRDHFELLCNESLGFVHHPNHTLDCATISHVPSNEWYDDDRLLVRSVDITDLGGYLACSTNTKLATPSALHVGAGDKICLILLRYSNLLHGQGGASTVTTGGSRNFHTPPTDVARIVSVNLSTSSAC